MVNPVPDGYTGVIPYLVIEGAAAAIDFYTSVLGATERMRMPMPDGRVAHAELEINNGVLMLADSGEQSGPSPQQVGGSPVTVMAYVPDVDATYQKAIDAGAESTMKPENRFYGDRMCAFTDPFGHKWNIASHVEDVSEAEMEKRTAEMTGGH